MPALLAALALAMTAAEPASTYLAFGDSTGVGVGARHGGGYPARLASRLAAGGSPVRLVNLCVSGAVVADVAARQLPRSAAGSPAVVTLGIGINDVVRGTEPSRFALDYERVAAVLGRTGAPVVVVNIPDLSLSPLAQGEATRAALRRQISELNAVIAATARRHGFTLVDLYAATETELAGDPALLSDDRFHPSDAGYERWTDLVEPALRAALGSVAAARAPLPRGPRLR